MRLPLRIAAPLALTVALLPLTSVAPALGQARPPGLPKGVASVKVVKIVEGDVVDVTTSKGKKLRVRLLQIDTPARGQCWAKAATARTAALLPLGKVAYVLADQDPRDRYGRWLLHVWNGKGVHVNRNLVRYGHAKAALHKPNARYLKVMRAEQAKAKADRLRVWSGRCDGTTPTTPTDPAPTTTPTPPPPGGTDPRFRTCGAANAAGYGPYVRGTDPEYAWYDDRDKDGIVCER